MKRAMVLSVGLMLGAATGASGQMLRVAAQGVSVGHEDTKGGTDADGFGFGGQVALQLGRFGVEGRIARASLNATQTLPPNVGTTSTETFTQIDVRANVRISSAFALEVGGGRQTFSPEFSSQDVGLVRVGFVTQANLTSAARVWARGAYLPATKFNGGGTASFAFETGFGASYGPANGRWQLSADYQFQRIDRAVSGVKVPLQLSVASVGFGLGL